VKLSWHTNATESSHSISHIITGLKTNVFKICSISVIRDDGKKLTAWKGFRMTTQYMYNRQATVMILKLNLLHVGPFQ